MKETKHARTEQEDAEIQSSEPEAGGVGIDDTTGVPACSKCRKPMMPRTKDGDWFWGCQDYPKCQGPTTSRPPVPSTLRKAVEAMHAKSTSESSKAAGCRHPLTRAWGNAAGRGCKCLLCKAELGPKDNAMDGSGAKGPAKSRRGSQKARQDELEECLALIVQAEAEVRAAAALLDDATKGEEGTRKAKLRAAKTKLMVNVTCNLGVVQNMLQEEKEKSQAAAGRPSHSG